MQPVTLFQSMMPAFARRFNARWLGYACDQEASRMDFDTRLGTAWNEHADDPAAVAARLPELAALVGTEAQWIALANLVHHVQAQHLGAWEPARAALDALAGHPAYVDAGPSGQARRRWGAALALSAGTAPATALAGLAPSDRVRALAMAAANRAENCRAPDAAGAAALWSAALDEAGRSGLPATDPLHRTLAATGNGIACVMEERASRSAAERDLMLSAAQAARTHWALAGTWLEVERAEYRLAMSWLQAGDPARAAAHAQACLDGIAGHDGPAFERFFGWEAMARARIASGSADAVVARAAIDNARTAFAALAPDDRASCAASLDALDSAFAAASGTVAAPAAAAADGPRMA